MKGLYKIGGIFGWCEDNNMVHDLDVIQVYRAHHEDNTPVKPLMLDPEATAVTKWMSCVSRMNPNLTKLMLFRMMWSNHWVQF
jgi:hypothetical protein